VKGQLFVTQLPLLLEQRTAQHCLGRQATASGLAQPVAPQIAGHQAYQRALSIQPLRDRLQLAADLVPGKTSNIVAWTVRSSRIVGSGGEGGSLDSMACIRSLPEPTAPCPF